MTAEKPAGIRGSSGGSEPVWILHRDGGELHRPRLSSDIVEVLLAKPGGLGFDSCSTATPRTCPFGNTESRVTSGVKKKKKNQNKTKKPKQARVERRCSGLDPEY